MNQTVFERKDERTIVVSEGFAPIVALCGYGETLRKHFKSESDDGRIVIVLREDLPVTNTDIIALADELFILNPNGQYDDFQADTFLTAQKLGKHIRVLKD